MSNTNPDYVLRAHLITKLLMSLDEPEDPVVDYVLRHRNREALMADLGTIVSEIIKAAKR